MAMVKVAAALATVAAVGADQVRLGPEMAAVARVKSLVAVTVAGGRSG